MNELRVIKIIISISLILVIAGGLMLWQKGWLNEELFLANVSELGVKRISEVSFLKTFPKLAGFNKERNYLLLFQNNLELRPSGGYLESFGIVKVKNAKVVSFEIHDTDMFDGFGKIQTDPPKPIKNYLGVNNWQMRDGNWSPDWPTAACQVEHFYHIQGGQETFDGIIAINATVLPNLLKLIGPIYLNGFNKKFTAETILYQLEYEIEKGYIEREIKPGERKNILKALFGKILDELTESSLLQKNNLRKLAINELTQKNILLFFKDSKEQEVIDNLGWSGRINQLHQGDYLMINEANLGAKKSNAFIKREVEYFVDLSKNAPIANLKIKYIHSNTEKDWFNDDYRAYLRIYLPYKSWLLEAYGVENKTEFLDEFGKTVFGNWIIIPAGQEKTIEFSYLLPAQIKEESDYHILIQKQSGISNLPIKLILKEEDKEVVKKKNIIKENWEEVVQRPFVK